MTLEEFFKSPISSPFRYLLKLGINGACILFPRLPAHMAKKMRELFSARVNDLLYEHFFLYNTTIGEYSVPSRYVSLNTPLPIECTFSGKDYVQSHFYFHGMPSFFTDLLFFCDQQTVFFDIGANMGLVSAGLARFMPQKHIVAFEALPSTHARLKSLFDLNCPRARSFNMALSSSSGNLTFTIPSSDSGSASANIDAEELIRTRGADISVRRETAPCEPFSSVYAQLIATGGLDHCKRHAFKIDVEGHEVEVLEGMIGYFTEFDGEIFIVVEVRTDTAADVHRLLHSNGFVPYRSESSAATINGNLGDCIYLRQAR